MSEIKSLCKDCDKVNYINGTYCCDVDGKCIDIKKVSVKQCEFFSEWKPDYSGLEVLCSIKQERKPTCKDCKNFRSNAAPDEQLGTCSVYGLPTHGDELVVLCADYKAM